MEDFDPKAFVASFKNFMERVVADTTTNRPEILELALASRPGRVDQAIRIPLPDAAYRQRLFARHGEGLDLRLERLEAFVARTEGASAAFLRELLRRAALASADEGASSVTDAHVDAALRELPLDRPTKSLLGAANTEKDG